MKTMLNAIVAAAILGASATTAMAGGAKIFVVGGKADDPFWSIVKRGAEDAGKVVSAEGGKVIWLAPQNYDNLGADAAELIRQAIDQHADAIVGPTGCRQPWTLPSRQLSPPTFRWWFTTPAASRRPIGWARLITLVPWTTRRASPGANTRQGRQSERRLRQLSAGCRQHRRLLQGLRRRHQSCRRQGRCSATAGDRGRQRDGRHASGARVSVATRGCQCRLHHRQP